MNSLRHGTAIGLVTSLLCALLLWQCATPVAHAQPADTPLTLEGLLDAVKQGRAQDSQQEARRLQRFQSAEQERQTMLSDIRQKRALLEQTSAELETQFESNEMLIGELETRLKERMGTLKELFGVLQQTASDAQGQFHTSLSQLEHPERSDFLVEFAGRMAQSSRLPDIGEIERLWFELQREMTRSGEIVTRDHSVVTRDGAEVSMPVTRIGLFNVVADGKYLQFVPETGRLIEFSRQPNSRYLQGPRALASDTGNDLTPFAVDPVRGQLLELLTRAPDLRERIAQGGLIGYTIIALGCIGFGIALWRFLALALEARRLRQQLEHIDSPDKDNALGRILLAANSSGSPDPATLELQLGEAVMGEIPRINRMLPLLKIIAAVAPLMGLLGTVTGMIITFQAITLFGAGDPRLMAGGISQALITTVLGLCVAIPILLMHNIVQTRAKSLTDMLQHKAVALVASKAEQRATHPEHGPVNSSPGMAA